MRRIYQNRYGIVLVKFYIIKLLSVLDIIIKHNFDKI